ncbi:Cytochrome P450 7B1 [Gaertneriomyces sp. JEL0708]|nr:Cytochrome P450 7B1 [Gaertneriomyces sp. JEL0708]
MLALCVLVRILVSLLPRSAQRPPFKPSWIPYLGIAIEYGKDSETFLAKSRSKYGDIFSATLAGRRTTFILDPLTIPRVYKNSKVFDFKPISDDIASRAFGASREALNNQAFVSAIHSSYIRLLTGDSLRDITDSFCDRLSQLLWRIVQSRSQIDLSDGWEVDLYDWTRRVIFEASGRCIFGEEFTVDDNLRDFTTFDKAMPLFAGGLPSIFYRASYNARERLIHRLQDLKLVNAAPFLYARDKAIADSGVCQRDRGAWSLGVLWASQGNTIPAIFWSYAYAITHPDLVADLQEELATVVPTDRLSSTSPFRLGPIMGSVSQLPRLSSAVSETLRTVSSVFSIRVATHDTSLKDARTGKDYFIGKNEWVMISTRSIHQDAGIYPKPDSFRPTRFLNVQEKYEVGVNVHAGEETRGTAAVAVSKGRAGSTQSKRFYKDGKVIKHNLLPFGGGTSLCPGRHFAVNEIKAFMAIMLTFFEATPVDPNAKPPPLDRTRYGFGVVPPKGDIRVRLRVRAPILAKLGHA